MPEENLTYDPERAAAAFDRVKPRLEAIADGNLEQILVDLQAAAPVVLAVAELCADPEIKARFDLLPEEVFDKEHLSGLADLAWAGWYARASYLSVDATESAAMPSELLMSSQSLKETMFKVIDYNLGGDPVVAAELASIRSGSGHLDLASDLTRLATLYDNNAPELKTDKRYYREEDATEARSAASKILKHLGAKDETLQTWMSHQQRIWHLLRSSYDEVAATGAYLFRHDSRKHRFPSLFAATRKKRRGQKAAGTGETTDGNG